MPINPFPEQDPDQLFYQEWDALDPKKPAPIEELPEEDPEDESAFFEEFGKGVAAGVIQEDALIFGAARAGYGSFTGDEETFNAGMNYYQERMEAAAEYAPRASWDEDWDSFSDRTNFFAYTLGNAIPSIATGIAFGGAGGVATKAAAKKFASDRIERIAKERMEAAATATADQIARDAVQGAFRKQVANKYAKIGGATTAGVGTGATLHFGENFSRIYEETGLQDPGVALTTAMFSGALDSVGIPFRALRQLFPDDTRMLSNLKEHIAENVLTTNGRKRFGNMAREAGLVAGTEGLIEAGQEFMTRSAVMWAKENLPEEQQAQFIGYMSDDEAFSNYRHAFVAGTIGGMSIGAGIGAAQPVNREDGVTTLNNEIEKKRLEAINEAKRVAAEEAEKPLDQTPIDLPPVDGPVQAIDVETGQIVDVPDALVQESDAAPVQEVIPESDPTPEEEINLDDFDFTDTVETIAVIPGGARLEDIAESRGVESTDQQEILDILEERGLVTQSIDSGVVTYSVRDDLDAEPEISVPAEETPTPTAPVEPETTFKYSFSKEERQALSVRKRLADATDPIEQINAAVSMITRGEANNDASLISEGQAVLDTLEAEGYSIQEGTRKGDTRTYSEGVDGLSREVTYQNTPNEGDIETVERVQKVGILQDGNLVQVPQITTSYKSPEPLADTQGRVEPTVSPAPEETTPTEPVVEDTGFGGEYRVTFPETGNQYRINQYAQDAGGGFYTFVENEAVDLAETIEASVEALGQIDSGAETTTAFPSEPMQRRNRDNENQIIIEFPDSGNTYTIERRGEGNQAEWFNVDTNARIGVSRDESIEQLKTAERLASMSRGRRNIEEPPVPTTLSGERASPRGLSGTSRTQQGIPVVQRDSVLDVPFNEVLGEVNGPDGPSVNRRIDALNASEGRTVQQKEGDDLVVVQRFGGNYKLFSHIKGRPKRKGGRSNGRPTSDMSWLPDALPSPELKSLLEEYSILGGPELSAGLDELPPQLQEYMHGILEVIERGIPVEWAFGTTGVYINKGEDSGLATYYVSEKALGVKKDFLESAVADPAKRRYLTHAIAHEIFHYADFKNGYTRKTDDSRAAFGDRSEGDRDINVSAFESLDISSSKKDGDRISFDMGDVTAELYELWSTYDETIGYQFRYPLKSAYLRLEEAHNSGDPNRVDDVEEFLRTEMFAQLGAVYIGNPRGLKEKAPKAYAMIRSIVLNPNLTAAEVIFEDSNIRESVEPSGRSVLQDVRSPTVAGSGEVSDRGRVGPDGTGRDLGGTTSEGMGGAPTTEDGDTSGRLIPTRPNTLDIRLEDLPPESQQLTATPILYGDETPRSVEGNPTVVKVAREFDNKAKEAYLDRDLSEQTDENAEIVSDLIAHEAIQAIEREGNAGEWYQQKVANAMELAAQKYPELGGAANDPAPKFAFTAIMAVTSNGASVPENSINTFKLYDEYRQNGEFTIFGVGKEGPAMKQSFKLLNKLIKADGIDNVINFMNEDITVRELKSDFGLTVSGELQDTVLKGSAILGPKIGGGFYQNLNGNFDPLTMDRWFMRTFGRLTGSLMKEADRKYPIQLAKFREIALSDEYRNKLKRDGISRVKLKKDDEYAEAYVKKVQREYAKGGFKNKTEINLASNTFVNSQGETQAPQRGSEREYIRSVMQMALDKVNVSFPEINMGALQAIIWYPEKQLYKLHGVGNKRSEPTDYETEFRKIVQGEEGGQGVLGPDRSALESGTGTVQRTTGESQRDAAQLDSPTVQESPKPKRSRNVLGIEDPTPSFNAVDETLTALDAETRLQGKIRTGRQKVVDRLEGLKRLEDIIAERIGLERLPSELSAYDAENLMHSKVQKQLEEFEVEHVEPIAELVKGSGLDIDQVGLYLLAKHAPERNRRMFEKEQELRAKQMAALQRDLENTEVQDPEGSPAIRQKIEDLEAAPFRFEDNGSGMTYAQAASVIEQAEADGKTEQLEAVSTRIYEMLDQMRENMVKKGLLDEETRADWEDTYQFYVPLKGFASYAEGLEIKGNPKAAGFSIRGSESFKARGRVTLPVNPLLVSFKDAEEKIVRAEKNQIAQRLLTMLSKNQDKSLWSIWNNRNRPESETRTNEKMTLDEMKRERRKDDGLYKYIQVKRGGQTFFIEIKDRELNRQLQTSGVGMFNNTVDFMNVVLAGLQKFQNFRRNMLINYNPSWGLVNPLRDIQTGLAFALSEQDVVGGRIKNEELIGKIALGYKQSGFAFMRYRRGKEGATPEAKEYDKYTREYVEDGAPTGLSVSKSLEEQQKRFEAIVKQGSFKKKLKAAGKAVEDFNQTMENSVRLSTYVEARKAGVARADAATLAKDLTVNFNRKGEYSSAIDSLYLFFNAAVQGNVNIAKALLREGSEGQKITKARSLAATMVVWGFARTVFNIMNAGLDDDDEPVYKDYNEYALRTGMLFAFEGQGVAMPMPYGWGVFDNIGRYAAEFAYGIKSPSETALNMASALDHHFNPMSLHASKDGAGVVDAALQKGLGLFPDVMEVGLELYGNINFFGGDIKVPQNAFLTPEPESVPTKRGTNEVISGITQFINYATAPDGTPNVEKYRSGVDINPEQVQHLYEFFMGGVGRFFDDTSDTIAKMVSEDKDLKTTDLPILRTFLPLPSEYSDRVEFYRNRDSFRQYRDQYRDANAADRAAIEAELGTKVLEFNLQDKAANKTLRELSNEKKSLENNALIDPVVRIEALRRIAEMQEAVFDKYNRNWEKVKP